MPCGVRSDSLSAAQKLLELLQVLLQCGELVDVFQHVAVQGLQREFPKCEAKNRSHGHRVSDLSHLLGDMYYAACFPFNVFEGGTINK